MPSATQTAQLQAQVDTTYQTINNLLATINTTIATLKSSQNRLDLIPVLSTQITGLLQACEQVEAIIKKIGLPIRNTLESVKAQLTAIKALTQTTPFKWTKDAQKSLNLSVSLFSTIHMQINAKLGLRADVREVRSNRSSATTGDVEKESAPKEDKKNGRNSRDDETDEESDTQAEKRLRKGKRGMPSTATVRDMTTTGGGSTANSDFLVLLETQPIPELTDEMLNELTAYEYALYILLTDFQNHLETILKSIDEEQTVQEKEMLGAVLEGSTQSGDAIALPELRVVIQLLNQLDSELVLSYGKSNEDIVAGRECLQNAMIRANKIGVYSNSDQTTLEHIYACGAYVLAGHDCVSRAIDGLYAVLSSEVGN